MQLLYYFQSQLYHLLTKEYRIGEKFGEFGKFY